jgi:FkbM family methyltransferase
MTLWRRGLERLSTRVVLERHLPAGFGGGRISVSPASALKFWYPNLERVDPSLFDAASELVRPGDIVWDIGANVGLFTFAAAALAGRKGKVLALEPDIWLTGLLHRTISRDPQSWTGVDVLAAAASDHVGLCHLKIAARGRSSNYLGEGNSQSGGSRAVQSTLSVTLDWLLSIYPPPHVLKIDVEGAEALVLKGATRVLSQVRPRILCEVNGDNSQEVSSLLRAAGYTFYDADQPKVARKQVYSAPWNTIAYPAT